MSEAHSLPSKVSLALSTLLPASRESALSPSRTHAEEMKRQVEQARQRGNRRELHRPSPYLSAPPCLPVAVVMVEDPRCVANYEDYIALGSRPLPAVKHQEEQLPSSAKPDVKFVVQEDSADEDSSEDKTDEEYEGDDEDEEDGDESDGGPKRNGLTNAASAPPPSRRARRREMEVDSPRGLPMAKILEDFHM